jgi:hypothetical protein
MGPRSARLSDNANANYLGGRLLDFAVSTHKSPLRWNANYVFKLTDEPRSSENAENYENFVLLPRADRKKLTFENLLLKVIPVGTAGRYGPDLWIEQYLGSGGSRERSERGDWSTTVVLPVPETLPPSASPAPNQGQRQKDNYE